MNEDTARRIKDIIASGDIVLFMKGVPAAPQCGFSAAVVKILSGLAVPFKSIDVLADMNIREGIKPSRTGRRSRSSMSKASLSAAATSSARCFRRESSPRC